MAERRQMVGRAGEEAAVRFLHEQGYRIVERNYRCRFGEIDLIARDGEILAFIEVKTRRSRAFGPPALAVTIEKQRHLVKASQMYLTQRGKAHELCRFDVVTIEMDAHTLRIEVIKNAFQARSEMG
jgi:putative endonuclease